MSQVVEQSLARYGHNERTVLTEVVGGVVDVRDDVEEGSRGRM